MKATIAKRPVELRPSRRRRGIKKEGKSGRVVTWGEKFGHLRGLVKGAPKDLSEREGFA